MSARLSKADEIELAREFLDSAYAMIEDGDDTVYEMLDPECKYGDNLVRCLNNDTVREILSLGFRAKYGEDGHKPVRKRRARQAHWSWSGVEYYCAVCSKCGGLVGTGFKTASDAVAGWPGLYPFCPYCGTPMRSSEYDGPWASLFRPPEGRGQEVRTLPECDGRDWQLAEWGIMYICPDPRCPLHSECPYAARTNYEEGGEK